MGNCLPCNDTPSLVSDCLKSITCNSKCASSCCMFGSSSENEIKNRTKHQNQNKKKKSKKK